MNNELSYFIARGVGGVGLSWVQQPADVRISASGEASCSSVQTP